jgi:hypothetical protein
MALAIADGGMKIKRAEISIGTDLLASAFQTSDGGAPAYAFSIYRPGTREQVLLMFDGAAPVKEMQTLVDAFNDLQDAISNSKKGG